MEKVWLYSVSGSNLDKRVVQQHAGSPAAFGFALQTVTQEVLPLCADLLRDGRLVAHAHLVHDLEVVLILVPGPLQVRRRNTRREKCCALVTS